MIVVFPDHTHLLFCKADVEDRVHFVLEYSRLDPVRQNYLMKIQSIVSRIDAGVSIEIKVSKDAKIRNRYNQVPHLTQDTNRKVTNSQLDTTNERQEVSPFPVGDHKAHINRRIQSIANTRQKKT